MNDQKSGGDGGDKSWIEKIALAFSSEPKNRSDLSGILTIARDNEVIDDDAYGIIEGAMKVADMQARDIMVPRPQMEVIRAEASLQEILPQITASAHSRYPVIGETTDDVLGILLAKDLLAQVLEPQLENFSVTALMRPTNVVPESKRLNVLLREFRENRNHMAIVIDEYGGVAGLVTIEDVLEEIVGEIEDETDIVADRLIRKVVEGEYLVDALTPIDEFNEELETDFSDDEFDTIGGLVMQQFGHLPGGNETTTLDHIEFKVESADQRKINSLRVRVRKP
jgi:magnesium and cobalt transporter